jgi:hypothetical protein
MRYFGSYPNGGPMINNDWYVWEGEKGTWRDLYGRVFPSSYTLNTVELRLRDKYWIELDHNPIDPNLCVDEGL